MFVWLGVVVLASAVQGWQNYQGEWPCSSRQQSDIYPRTLEELQRNVRDNRYVKGVGSGHSWDSYIGCAGTTSEAVNIVMTEFEKGDRHVDLDLDDMSIKVPASMMTRDLLRYLDEQRSDQYPRGLSLRSYPWWIDQTLCGAVATGTHGSSMHEDGGSLSSQVRCLGMVLADGEYKKFCEDTHPEEMQALRVSAGRLGIIAHCFMKVIPSENVRVSRQALNRRGLIRDVETMEELFISRGEGALARRFDNTQYAWFVPTDSVQKWTYELQGTRSTNRSLNRGIGSYNLSNPETVELPELRADQMVGENVTEGSNETLSLERQPVSMEDLMELAEEAMSRQDNSSSTARDPLLLNLPPSWWSDRIENLFLRWYPSGTFSYKDAFLQNPTSGTEYTTYDQYEYSVPISSAGRCMRRMARFIDRNQVSSAFRSPVLVRLVKAENNILLSNTRDEPRLYMNVNDDLSYNMRGDQENEPLRELGHFLRNNCDARLHWGKTKSTLPRSSDLDGEGDYQDTWCDFGRFVSQLDPTKKFAGDAGRGSSRYYWDWSEC
mmetsp:Transcript_8204/g.29126  ORF Transcript_8204/g.29126 Transcript_8204/m.29126 type:complete len:549 (+) Transcript_8204:120-1766(+)